MIEYCRQLFPAPPTLPHPNKKMFLIQLNCIFFQKRREKKKPVCHKLLTTCGGSTWLFEEEEKVYFSD